MADDDEWGDPIPVTEMPVASTRGGRKSTAPGLIKWFDKLTPGQTFELPSKDADSAHPVSRVTQMRKLAEPLSIKIDTRPVVAGKRYRIFATKGAGKPETKNNGKSLKSAPEPAKEEATA